MKHKGVVVMRLGAKSLGPCMDRKKSRGFGHDYSVSLFFWSDALYCEHSRCTLPNGDELSVQTEA
jgi:hypothetical protein